MNGLHGLDYLLIAIGAIGALYGLRRGALRMITSVLSLGAGCYIATLYYARVGALAESQFGVRAAVGSVIGYLIVFAIIFAAVEIIGGAAIRLLQIAHLSPLDRLAGGMLGASVAAALAGLTVILIATVIPPDSPTLRDSRLVPMLLAYNQALVGLIPGDTKLAYERTRDHLMKSWVQNALKARSIVPSPAASPSPSAK